MKKFSSIVMIALMAITVISFSSCNSKLKELKADIETAQVDLPYDLGSTGSMTAIDLNEDAHEVVAVIEVGQNMFSPAVLSTHKELIKKNLLLTADMNSSVSALLEKCAAAECSFTYKYQFDDGTDPIDITLKPEEVNNYAHMTEDEAHIEYLKNQVLLTKATLPLQVDEYTIMTDMQYDANYLTYVYTVDESEFSVSDLETAADAMKDNILSSLTAGVDQSLTTFVNICREANEGIKYIYTGSTTGDQLVITIEANEL